MPVLLVLLVGQVLLLARMLLAQDTWLFAGDFRVFYAAAHRLAAGQPLYQVGDMAYLNPPFFALLLIPLALLPLPIAHGLWSLIALLATAASCRLLLGPSRATAGRRLWLWASLLSLPVLLGNVVEGQNTCLVLLGVALWYALTQRERPISAGAALGLMLVKPQFALGPIVSLIAGRRWRELAGFAGAAAMLGGLSLALVGASGVTQYFAVAQDVASWVSRGPFFRSDMHTLRALLYGLLPSNSAGAVSLLASLLVMALVARRAWGDARSTISAQTASVAVLGSLLAAPYAHTHDLIFLIVPWLLLGPGAQRPLAVLLIASYVAPVVNLFSIAVGGPPQITVPINAALFLALAFAPSGLPAPLRSAVKVSSTSTKKRLGIGRHKVERGWEARQVDNACRAHGPPASPAMSTRSNSSTNMPATSAMSRAAKTSWRGRAVVSMRSPCREGKDDCAPRQSPASRRTGMPTRRMPAFSGWP
jgi:hypothetical protein